MEDWHVLVNCLTHADENYSLYCREERYGEQGIPGLPRDRFASFTRLPPCLLFGMDPSPAAWKGSVYYISDTHTIEEEDEHLDRNDVALKNGGGHSGKNPFPMAVVWTPTLITRGHSYLVPSDTPLLTHSLHWDGRTLHHPLGQSKDRTQ